MSYLADPSQPLTPLQFGGATPASIGDAGREYREMGLREVALECRSKESVGKWSIAREPESLDGLYAGGANVGIVLGELSRGLGDIDCDWPEVAAILAHSSRLAQCPTFGRENLPASHFLFRFEGDHTRTQFGFTKDEAAALGLGEDDKAMAAELRGNRHYTMFPPSVHPSGVRIAWKRPGAPPMLAWPEVEATVARVAVLAVIVRKWPRVPGNRDELALALTGACIGSGMSDEDANATVSLVAKLAGDEEHARRGTKATATREKMDAGDPCTGLTRVCELLGIASVAPKLAKWWTWGKPKAKRKGESKLEGRDLARSIIAKRPAPLIFHQEEWAEYEGGRYRIIEDTAIRAEIYDAAEAVGVDLGARGVSSVADGLKTLVLVPKHLYSPTCWINGATGPDPRHLLNCANGILDPVTRDLRRHSPDLLTFNRLPYEYNPEATCPRFERFLAEVWPEEEDARLVLQEFMGYLLTGDTSYEKILCLIGAKRSGKGTLNHIIRRVVGEENVASPKLQSFGETFGRQCLIGKRVAILADVRIGPRTDVSSAASTLLEISGRDPQSIPRKFLGNWEGHLETRLVLMSNLPISITDPAGVLPSRYLTLAMRQSFAGREDPTLKESLSGEVSGVLNWALDGLDRLRTNRRFSALESSADLQRQTENLASGLGMFIDECLEFGPSETHFITKEGLYETYLAWFHRQGYPESLRLSKEMFGSQFVGHTIDRGVCEVQRRGADPARPDARPWGWKCIRRRDGADLTGYGSEVFR